MQIVVTGRHVEVPAEVREYVEAKAEKLPRYYNRIQEIEVIFDHESDLVSAELIVRADRKQTFVARETGPDTLTLIDVIVEKVERQLRRYKEKNRNHKHNEIPEVTDDTV